MLALRSSFSDQHCGAQPGHGAGGERADKPCLDKPRQFAPPPVIQAPGRQRDLRAVDLGKELSVSGQDRPLASIHREPLEIVTERRRPLGTSPMARLEISQPKEAHGVKVGALRTGKSLQPVRHRDAAMPFSNDLERREDVEQLATGFEDAGDLRQRQIHVRDMLEHLVGNHGLKAVVGERQAVIGHRENRSAPSLRSNVVLCPRAVEEYVRADHVVAGISTERDHLASPATIVENRSPARRHLPKLGDHKAVQCLRHKAKNLRLPGLPVQRKVYPILTGRPL